MSHPANGHFRCSRTVIVKQVEVVSSEFIIVLTKKLVKYYIDSSGPKLKKTLDKTTPAASDCQSITSVQTEIFQQLLDRLP